MCAACASPPSLQVPDLSAGEDPDDAFSRVPYEKGFYFLYYLQVSGRSVEGRSVLPAGQWKVEAWLPGPPVA